MATKKKGDPATYTQAATELEGILEEIESGTADIDELSDKVERAAALIRVCRDKLSGTELRVKKVVEEMGEAEEASD